MTKYSSTTSLCKSIILDFFISLPQFLRADSSFSVSPFSYSNNELASVRANSSDIVNLPISLAFQISRRAGASSSAEAMDVQRSVFILYNRIHPVDLVKRKISASLNMSACVFLSRSDVEKDCILAFTEALDSLVYILACEYIKNVHFVSSLCFDYRLIVT